ncbi:hypothetical protein LWI29_027406 [Acer saccharum]|uniref:C2H2-type domain-containing protein n=1 Tax=Acer saccharum TaxID=4024 RepID=A0AA39S727_ACESA|nr:hypothetical protein LWI29_027406 [Acer saccharum]
MGKRKSCSTSDEPPVTPPSTTVDQPLESVHPEIIPAIIRRAIALRQSGEHEKALNFIKDSISSYPLSGKLRYTEGRIHSSLAKNATVDDEAKVKHLEDGVRSAQLAADLLPNSLHCACMLVNLVYELAFFNQDWDRVIKACKSGLKIACKRGLKIGKSADYWIRKLFGGDESMIEDEKQSIIMQLQDARKKQLKAITKKLKDNKEDILKYKSFWSNTLSDEKKRRFRKVNIEIGELESHFKSLKYQSAVDLLLEAIDFAKKHKTWKFWECYDCVKKFSDWESYRNHFWELHWLGKLLIWEFDDERLNESIDIFLNSVWKPVDTDKTMKFIVNSMKSMEGLDECKNSSVEDFPVNNSKSDDNLSSKTSMDHPKWEFCDDIERSEILGRIRSLFCLLSKNNCLPLIHFRWAIEYAVDQLQSEIPLSQFRNLGLETPQIICFLGASQLTELLTFFEDLAHKCGLSEKFKIDNSMDDKHSGHHDIKERVLFSRDFSCILLRRELNVTKAVAGDDSAVSFSADECEDDMLPDSDDIVSWLYGGSNCKEGLESWSSLRESRRSQALKSRRAYFEKLSVLPNICSRNAEKNSNKLTAIQTVESMILQEIEKREKSPEYEPQLYMDLLKNRQKKLKEINNSFVTSELDDISEVLEEQQVLSSEFDLISEVMEKAQEIPSRDQSQSEGCCVEDESRMQECMKQRDSCIEKALRMLKKQLLKDSRLNNLYEDAQEKSKAAEDDLLADVAVEAEKKINNGFDNVKQKQDKKKKKRNKNVRKTKESKATDDNKHLELHEKDAEQNDNPNSNNDDSLDEPKQSTASDEILALLEEMALEADKDSAVVKQNQDKKKKKKKNKNPETSKESEATDASGHIELHLTDEEQNDNPDCKNDDSLDKPKQSTVADEARRLGGYLEILRQFEHEVSQCRRILKTKKK